MFLIIHVNPGGDRENTTVLPTCSGSGKFLPPMVVFSGQHVQTTWKPEFPSNHKTILGSMQIILAGWIAVHFLNGLKNLNKKQETLKKYVNLFGPFFPFSDKMTS